MVAELFALYREPGTSLMRLAVHLDARGVPTPSGRPRWSSPTVRGILRNPTYTGQVYAQRTQYRAPTHRRSATHPIGRPHGTAVSQPADSWLLVGQVPAVVSQAHFDEVQTKLATNRSFARRNNTAHPYLLRALVSCGHCGLACTARAINKRNLYYLCNGKGHSTYSHRATCCPARYTPASQLDELVWKDLCALLAEPGPLAVAVERAHGGAWLPQELLARRETLRRAQAHLSQQLERLTDAYLRAVFPLDEYERRRRDLEQRMRALAGQEELLRHDVARRQQLAGVAASLEAFRARVQHGLAAASFEQRRQLVLLLIDRVIVTDAEVEIRYVLPTNPESEHVRFCHLRKDYFDHPSPWQHLEPGWALRWRLAGGDPYPGTGPPMTGDLQRPAQGRGQPVGQPAIGRVGPNQPNTWERPVQARQHELGGGAIMQVGRQDLGLEQQTLRVDHQMALAAVDLLAAVIATRPAHLGGLDRLAVDDRGGRLRGASHLLAHPLAQRGVDRLPQAAQAPLPEIVEDRLPGREASWQHPPGHAATQEVEDRVEDLVQHDRTRASSCFRSWKQGFKDRILFNGQITAVAFRIHLHYIYNQHSQTSSDTRSG